MFGFALSGKTKTRFSFPILFSPDNDQLWSILFQCFDDIYLYTTPVTQMVLSYLDIVYAAIFVIEMILKLIGVGLKKYFTSFWTILDFTIVVVSFELLL